MPDIREKTREERTKARIAALIVAELERLERLKAQDNSSERDA
jgi:hypothetical protein